MSLAYIEQAPQPQAELHLQLVEPPNERPLVMLAPEMAEDMWPRQQAERLFRSVGNTVLQSQVEVESVPEDDNNLMGTIHRAKEGCPTAIKRLDLTISTDLTERSYGIFATDVPLSTTSDGQIEQYGQTTYAIHHNTLEHAAANPKMRARSKAETRNGFRAESANRQGLFDEGYLMVAFTLADDEMTNQELQANGFFRKTISGGIHITGKDLKGDLNLQAGFVAGVKDEESERHDIQAVVGVAARFGVDYSDMSTTDMIDNPLFIHKSLIPNGLTDVFRMYDEQIPGQSFMGQDTPVQDYEAFVEDCQLRAAAFEPAVQAIRAQLIAEADQIDTPIKAIERLNQLSQDKSVIHSLGDKTIDPQVFGPVAAPKIEKARWELEQGNIDSVEHLIRGAMRTAISYSCPSALRKAGEDMRNNGFINPNESSDKELDCPEVKDGQAVNCPYCKRKVLAIVKGDKISCSNSKCSEAHNSVKNKKVESKQAA